MDTNYKSNGKVFSAKSRKMLVMSDVIMNSNYEKSRNL